MEQTDSINHTNIESKKHGVPAIISFFIPGLGQIIKGQIGKGLLIWLLGGLIAAVAVFGAMDLGKGGDYTLLTIGIISSPILYIWNIYDAYNSN